MLAERDPVVTSTPPLRLQPHQQLATREEEDPLQHRPPLRPALGLPLVDLHRLVPQLEQPHPLCHHR